MQVQPEPVLKDEHALVGLRMNAKAAGEGEGNQYALHVAYSKRPYCYSVALGVELYAFLAYGILWGFHETKTLSGHFPKKYTFRPLDAAPKFAGKREWSIFAIPRSDFKH